MSTWYFRRFRRNSSDKAAATPNFRRKAQRKQVHPTSRSIRIHCGERIEIITIQQDSVHNVRFPALQGTVVHPSRLIPNVLELSIRMTTHPMWIAVYVRGIRCKTYKMNWHYLFLADKCYSLWLFFYSKTCKFLGRGTPPTFAEHMASNPENVWNKFRVQGSRDMTVSLWNLYCAQIAWCD